MQACGERKWTSRPDGDHAGEHDGRGTWRVPARSGGPEQGERLPRGTYVRPRPSPGVQDSPRPLRELPSEDIGGPSGPGGRVRTPCGKPVHEGADAVSGGSGVRRDLRRALQQVEHLADDRLCSRGRVPVAVARAGRLLSGAVRGLRSHQGVPQEEGGDGGVLCGIGRDGGRDA